MHRIKPIPYIPYIPYRKDSKDKYVESMKNNDYFPYQILVHNLRMEYLLCNASNQSIDPSSFPKLCKPQVVKYFIDNDEFVKYLINNGSLECLKQLWKRTYALITLGNKIKFNLDDEYLKKLFKDGHYPSPELFKTILSNFELTRLAFINICNYNRKYKYLMILIEENCIDIIKHFCDSQEFKIIFESLFRYGTINKIKECQDYFVSNKIIPLENTIISHSFDVFDVFDKYDILTSKIKTKIMAMCNLKIKNMCKSFIKLAMDFSLLNNCNYLSYISPENLFINSFHNFNINYFRHFNLIDFFYQDYIDNLFKDILSSETLLSIKDKKDKVYDLFLQVYFDKYLYDEKKNYTMNHLRPTFKIDQQIFDKLQKENWTNILNLCCDDNKELYIKNIGFFVKLLHESEQKFKFVITETLLEMSYNCSMFSNYTDLEIKNFMIVNKIDFDILPFSLRFISQIITPKNKKTDECCVISREKINENDQYFLCENNHCTEYENMYDYYYQVKKIICCYCNSQLKDLFINCV